LPKIAEISMLVFTFKKITYILCIYRNWTSLLEKRFGSYFFTKKTLTFSLFVKGWTIRSCEQPQPEFRTAAFFPEFRQ
jgi:hypothetical protein